MRKVNGKFSNNKNVTMKCEKWHYVCGAGKIRRFFPSHYKKKCLVLEIVQVYLQNKNKKIRLSRQRELRHKYGSPTSGTIGNRTHSDDSASDNSRSTATQRDKRISTHRNSSRRSKSRSRSRSNDRIKRQRTSKDHSRRSRDISRSHKRSTSRNRRRSKSRSIGRRRHNDRTKKLVDY